jgi:drug/metabolite transporter (DMT)-like permease
VAHQRKILAVFGLLMSAATWGVIWYPYRCLSAEGVTGLTASVLTYVLALLMGLPLYWRDFASVWRHKWVWLVLALSAGVTNTGYVLAVIHGEVMRVALLFYLAPLWTILLSRLMLAERLSVTGYWVMGLSMTGAVVMLWHTDGRWPLPNNESEWLGLAAGMGFAFSNVWARKVEQVSLGAKALAIWIGCTLLPILGLLNSSVHPLAILHYSWTVWGELGAAALAMFAATLLMQNALVRVAANRAIVILLFELVVTALSAWWLAGEMLVGKEWVGAAMIMAASVFSGHLEQSA